MIVISKEKISSYNSGMHLPLTEHYDARLLDTNNTDDWIIINKKTKYKYLIKNCINYLAYIHKVKYSNILHYLLETYYVGN